MRAHLTARRAPKVVTLLAAVVLLLAACGSSQASTTSGGTFTGAWVGPCCVGIANANPLIAGGDQSFLQLIYEPLVQYSVDKKTGGYGAPTPALAKSWSTSSNGLTWTFDLQPNVTWQDGSPFTAQDVIFTLTLCEDPQVACVYGGGIGDIKGAAEMKAGKATTLSGVSAPNPHTVTITTVSPNAALLDALSVIWIVQKKSLSGIPHAQIDKSSYWTTPGRRSARVRSSSPSSRPGSSRLSTGTTATGVASRISTRSSARSSPIRRPPSWPSTGATSTRPTSPPTK